MKPIVERIQASISNRPFWTFLFVGLVAAIVLFPQIGATHLWDEDEGFYASTAAEMMRAGQWLIPNFNGSLFAHKPPLMYWMMMSGFSIFGISEIGARFFSAIFGVLTVLLTLQLGRQLFSQRVGLISSLILATSVMFTVIGRSATADLFLTFFVTLSIWFFVCGTTQSGTFQTETKSIPTFCWFALAYGAMGLATLTKGPIGFLFPMAAIGLFQMLSRSESPASSPAIGSFRRWNRFLSFTHPKNFFGALWELRPLSAVAIIGLVAAPWFVLVDIKTNGAFLREFFGVHHFQRATSSMEGHRGSIVYYPVSIMLGMYPWTVATLPTTWLVLKNLSSKVDSGKGVKLLVCWIAVYIIGFTLAGTKLPNYVLPAYPAIALLYGLAIETWIRSDRRTQIFWGSAVLGVLVSAGVLIAVAFPAISFWNNDGKSLLERYDVAGDVKYLLARLGMIGVPAILCGTLAVWHVWNNRTTAAFWSLFAAAFLTVIVLWNLIAPSLRQFQGTQSLVSRLRQDTDLGDREIAIFEFFRPSIVFYSGRPVRRCFDLKQVDEFFTLYPNGLMMSQREKYDSIFKSAEFSYRIIDRQSTFPEKGELVVFARENGE